MDEQMITGGKLERDKQRATRRWRAEQNIVETEDGQLHVATVSGGRIAAHIADLHNRTVPGPDGVVPGSAADEIADRDRAVRNAEQDFAEGVAGAGPAIDFLRLGLPRGPINRDSCRKAFLAGWAAAEMHRAGFLADAFVGNRESLDDGVIRERDSLERPTLADPRIRAWLNDVRQPASRDIKRQPYWQERHGTWPTPERAWLEAGDRSGYLTRIAGVIETEVQRRVTHWLATEHRPSYSVKESPAMMVKLLRDLGYAVAEPGEAAR